MTKEEEWRTPQQIAFGEAWKLGRAGKHAAAIEKYALAMRPGEDNEDIHRNRGWCHRRLGQNEKALEDWAHVPEFAIARARALLDLGRLEDAVPEIKLALKKYTDKEDLPEVQQLLADTLTKLGRGDEAKAVAKKAAKKAAPKAATPSTLKDAAPIPKRKKGESYDSYATRLLAAAGLDKHAASFDKARVPGVLLEPMKSKAKPGASRLGGLPDLPATATWPAHKKSPMLFVLQVRLEDIAKLLPKGALPAAGMLSFFVCEGSAHDEYIDAVSVVFTPAKACAKLVAHKAPADLSRLVDGKRKKTPFGAAAVAPVAVRKLQNPGAPEFKKLPEDVCARYSDRVFEPAMAAFDGGTHQLLGVRDRSYDGTPRGARLLLQCRTEPTLDMHWGDDDALSVFAPSASFAKAAFTKATITCGD